MLLNNNIVFEIINSNFMDEVTACCEEAVLRMDEDELGFSFSFQIDVEAEKADLFDIVWEY